MEPRPWSGETLKKLSRHIRDGTEPPSSLPAYDDVMVWYDELVNHVLGRLEALAWTNWFGDRYRPPIGRAKTIQTLREKLNRMPSTHLPSIQDIAGVRLQMSMSLLEQDAVATFLCKHFAQDPAIAIEDLRDGSHAGYRAVHVLLNLKDLRGRVEIQIRTELQGEWANLYEELGDVLGREIRYEQLSSSDERRAVIDRMQGLSLGQITELEAAMNLIAGQKYVVDTNHPDYSDPVRKTWEGVDGGIDSVHALVAELEADLVAQLQSMRSHIQSITQDAE